MKEEIDKPTLPTGAEVWKAIRYRLVGEKDSPYLEPDKQLVPTCQPPCGRRANDNGNFGLNDLSLIAMSVLCVLLAWVPPGRRGPGSHDHDGRP